MRPIARWCVSIALSAVVVVIGEGLASRDWTNQGIGIVLSVAFIVVPAVIVGIVEGRKLHATPSDRSLLEDDNVTERSLVRANFRTDASRHDRGVLSLQGRRLVFVGSRSSCTMDLESVDPNSVMLVDASNPGKLSVRFPNGDTADFTCLHADPGEDSWRQSRLLKAVREFTGSEPGGD